MFISPHLLSIEPHSTGGMSVIDVEASALNGGYPIEIGVAFWNAAQGRICHEAKLIRHEPWLESGRWCLQAQSVHGITQEEIRDNGRPVEEVCEWLNEKIGLQSAAFVGDFRDTRWLSHAFDTAGKGMLFNVHYIEKLLEGARLSQESYFRFLEKTAHRAGHDAMQMYTAIMKCAGFKPT